MNDFDNLTGIPESMQAHVRGLLENLHDESPHKRSLLLETVRLIAASKSNADMKMVSSAIQEIRKGLEVFEPYQAIRKVCIFGSARTHPEELRYQQTRKVAEILRD
ncbi:MAG TPA: hypothetical protein DIW28_00545, partial [Zetaproteobacteria bacterium]|nr:hypothetical protein [Zetaproteobacteria bacterium]